MRIELVPRVTQAATAQALVLAIALVRASARRGKAHLAVAQVGTRKELRMQNVVSVSMSKVIVTLK